LNIGAFCWFILYHITIHDAKNIKFIAGEVSIYCRFPSFEGTHTVFTFMVKKPKDWRWRHY